MEKKYYDFLQQTLDEYWGSSQHKSKFFLGLPDSVRELHIALYGKSGTGKTRLIEAVVGSDIIRRLLDESQRGGCVVDPHGDLYQNLYDRLALLALEFPQLYQLVYLIDPTNERWSARLDLLEIKRLRPGENPAARMEQLATDIIYLFHDDPNKHVRQARVTTNLCWALSLSPKHDIADAKRFLYDRDLRERLVKEIRHPELERFWLKEFPSYHDTATLIDSTLNRLEPILRNPSLEFFFTGPSTIDFRELMDMGAIVLVNGRKDILGDRGAYLFCGMVLAKIQEAAMSRIDTPKEKRRPFAVIPDEYQTMITDTSRQIITEDRKLGIEFLFSTQDPIGPPETEELMKAIKRSVGSIISMRLDYDGAEAVIKGMFESDLYQVKAYVDGKPVFWSLAEIEEMEKRKITSLPNRMLYWKFANSPVSERLQSPTVKDVKLLASAEEIALARQLLDEHAFRLCGARKYKRLPAPRDGDYDSPVQSAPTVPTSGRIRTDSQE